MRLNTQEKTKILTEAFAVFGKNVTIRLFGSRVDDKLKGGDIDLHLDVDKTHCNFENELSFQVRLQKTLGERKIDVVIHELGTPLQAIDKIAIKTGIKLNP